MAKNLIEKMEARTSDITQLTDKVNEIIDIINAANYCLPVEDDGEERPPPYFKTPSAGFTPSEQRAFEINYYQQQIARLALVTPMSSTTPTVAEIIDKAIEIIETHYGKKEEDCEREAESGDSESHQGESS